MKIFVLLLAFLSAVRCYQSHQARIPNGIRVPDPCNSAQFWPGVGHQKKAGGGSRNPFGVLMGGIQVQWGRSVCETDSDGDGRTNGEELGDPNCQWSMGGNPPALSTNLSHPGICEPITSPDCCAKQTWLYCHNIVCDKSSETDGGDIVNEIIANGSDSSTTPVSTVTSDRSTTIVTSRNDDTVATVFTILGITAAVIAFLFILCLKLNSKLRRRCPELARI